MAWKQAVNKPAAKSGAPKPKFEANDDDWDTDLTYENAATEKSQRYGSASVPGSGRVDHVDFGGLQDKMKKVDQSVKEEFKDKNPTRGYGGKYGTEQVMDKAAQDFSYKADIKKHSSQTDGKKGFGGEYGIDERAKDQSAENFDYKPTVEKHSSQTDYTAGFAVKQEAKKDEPKQTPPASPKPAAPAPVKIPKPTTPTVATPPKPADKPSVTEKPLAAASSTKADVGGIRARFENINKEKESETAKRVAEERKKRAAVDQNAPSQPPTNKDNTPIEEKKQEIVREPSPVRPATPPQSSTSTVEEKVETTEPSTNTEEKNQASSRFIGTVNVTEILRTRKDSVEAPAIADEEWDDDN